MLARSGKFDTPRVYSRHLQQRLAAETCSRDLLSNAKAYLQMQRMTFKQRWLVVGLRVDGN
jgi:hypothetical protein